jgi:hypothetical protein
MERITHRAIPGRCEAPGGIGCRDGCNTIMPRLAQFLVGELGEVCCADQDDGGAHLGPPQKRRKRHRCQDQDGGDVGYVEEGHGCTGGAGRGIQ